ncbi:MAG: hypothetical protein AVDCRST_MAG34-1873, partial [uncultured Nocardioidaceae bacterium]
CGRTQVSARRSAPRSASSWCCWSSPSSSPSPLPPWWPSPRRGGSCARTPGRP